MQRNIPNCENRFNPDQVGYRGSNLMHRNIPKLYTRIQQRNNCGSNRLGCWYRCPNRTVRQFELHTVPQENKICIDEIIRSAAPSNRSGAHHKISRSLSEKLHRVCLGHLDHPILVCIPLGHVVQISCVVLVINQPWTTKTASESQSSSDGRSTTSPQRHPRQGSTSTPCPYFLETRHMETVGTGFNVPMLCVSKGLFPSNSISCRREGDLHVWLVLGIDDGLVGNRSCTCLKLLLGQQSGDRRRMSWVSDHEPGANLQK